MTSFGAKRQKMLFLLLFLTFSFATHAEFWSSKEDQKLIRLAKARTTSGHTPPWTVIAQYFPGKEPKQCRERYLYHLAPGIIKGSLTQGEKEFIIKLQQTYGNRWSIIAQFLPGRTSNQIKNFWHSEQRKLSKEKRKRTRKNTDVDWEEELRNSKIRKTSFQSSPLGSLHAPFNFLIQVVNEALEEEGIKSD